MTPDHRPIVFLTVKDFIARAKIGKTRLYEELKAGRLTARKHGRRTLIAEAEAERWMTALPAYHPPEALDHSARE